jgi:hypothetical protein
VEIQTHSITSNFLSGVLDPRVQGRVDTNAYASGLLQGENIEMVHLGGVQRRRGLVQRFVAPNQLTAIPGTGSFPNGGSLPDMTTTTPPNTTDPYVVVSTDLGSEQPVLFADVVDMTLAGGTSTEFCIQYSNDNVNWTTLGTSFPQLDSTGLYTYRRTAGVTFPPTYTTARYWRVAKIGGASLTYEVSLGEFNLWADSGNVSEGRTVSFEVSTNEQYDAVLTDQSAVIFCANTGTIVDYVAMPYLSADLALLDAQSTAESMMMTHEDYPPRFMIRLNSPLATGEAEAPYYNFQTFEAQFVVIPQVDYADSLSPTPTSETQTLAFNASWLIGDTFTLTILTDTTGPITYAGANSTTADAIATAVQALWVVNGFTGVSCVYDSAYSFTLTFADDAAGPMGVIAITSLSSSATAAANETQVGISRQEDAWSDNRGYPSTVTFYQGRMYLGGLRSQQETLVGSWVNDILNFDTAQGLDDQAIYATLNGVALNAVVGLFPARSLCVFTTGGEFRFVNDNAQPVTPTSFPTNQTQYGTAQIKPVMIDGNIIFVQRNRNSIRDFQFDYTQDQFNSLGLSSFAGNIVYDVQDLAAWNGSLTEEINLVFAVNGVNNNVNSLTNPNDLPDGSCAVFNTRKEANVQGWTIWTTQGEFTNVSTVVQSAFFLVSRNLNGTQALVFEEAVSGTFTDCGTGYVEQVGTQTVAGLNWLDGLTCRVRADGLVLDNVVPVNGQVTLTQDGRQYTTQIGYEIGLNYDPIVETMPLQTVRWPAGSNLVHKKRVVKASLKVGNTLGLIYNGEILPTTQIDTFDFDSLPVPYNGVIELEDSSNWDLTQDKTVTFTQVDPLPFYLMYIDIQLASEQ